MAVADQRRELFHGLIRIHVLLHASHEPIFGLGMMRELRHHGYRIGPGTLYPLLHGMEQAGLLKASGGESGDQETHVRDYRGGQKRAGEGESEGGRVTPRAS